MLFIFPNQWIPDSVIKALCWTFIHSLWQGVAAAIIAGIIVSSTRKAKAHLRYNLLILLLAFFLLAVSVSFFVQLSYFSALERSSPFLYLNISDAAPMLSMEGTFPMVIARQTVINEFTAFCNRNATFLMLLWFLFFVIKCLYAFSGLYYIHRLRKTGIYPPLEAWNHKLKQLSSALGIQKPVALLESRFVDVPLTIGCLKTTILVPIGILTQLSPEQVEAVLLHELAHIRRNDYLVNLLQSFAETLFFFNPALLWISALIRLEREACCDDMVLAHTPHKRPYLEALVSFEEYSKVHPRHAMALVRQKNHLFHRIRRMLTRENQTLNYMERTLLMLGIIAITALGFIAKPETLVTAPLSAATPSMPVVAAINTKLPSSGISGDTIKPVDKEVRQPLEIKKDDRSTEEQSEIDFADPEKPYQVINGTSYVMSRGGWARIDGVITDIIFVDGKRMTPEEVNRTIKRNSVRGIGATEGAEAKRKYGLTEPVLEIYIHTRPGWKQNTLSQLKEHKALLNKQEQKNTEIMKQMYARQGRLAGEREKLQKQKNQIEKQQVLLKEQAEQFKKQSALFEERAKKLKEQTESSSSIEQ